jgi:anthranilate phosphoribosyltransferase
MNELAPPAMHEILKKAVDQLLQKHNLSSSDTCAGIGAIMDGQCDAVDIAAFLTAMAAKGPVAEEIVGAARAMRRRATAIVTQRSPLLDTCGTGGDRLHTFNISTATALLSAACGVPVAKHGNRSVSSSSGSADVLEALGVNISLSAQDAGRCLDELGIAFCFAPLIHGAMKYAAPVRKQLGFPTIFNLLGPLTNPASAEYQLLGASSFARAELLANSLSQLGGRRSIVVCGNDELDEVSLWGTTLAYEITPEKIVRHEWSAASFGLPECRVTDLQVQTAAESGAVIRAAFAGAAPIPCSMVIANTAAALLACEKVTQLNDGVAMATNAIQAGAATDLLNRLIQWTRAI